MPRRWKPRHLQRTHILSQPLHARSILPVELWHMVLSYCPPLSLLAARDVCKLFRSIVDAKDGDLLARSPLLLPIPPPDPRFFMRVTRRPLEFTTLRDLFDITDPHKPGSYGSATYTRLLFRSGECYTCGKRTSGPPHCLEPIIYICSESCKQRFFRRKKMRFPKARANYRLPRSPCPEADRHIIPWLPVLTMGRMMRGKTALPGILLSDLEKARKEFREFSALPKGELFERYASRYRRNRALLQFQLYVDEWRVEWEKDLKEVTRDNERRVRSIVSSAGVQPAEAKVNPLIRQIVATRTRDLRRITPSSLKPKRAGITKSKMKDTCRICGTFVSAGWMDCHIANHHPDRVGHRRVNAATGKTEFRCELCPVARVRWFSATGLESHKSDRCVLTAQAMIYDADRALLDMDYGRATTRWDPREQ
ncbi:hypothetical protein FB107DRAFT_219315 [Schizophyllum commune]